ncbi:hypothetical protein OESDEN_00555 [Oesophagostomum dentatum]|uniref:Uncharacterized protein n=1 Tax=Oesophagostomum dentatum TaxID=61180 RepID=A0A0B1TTH5_OESDE|nr:hypothetical protein OESDEN_00555 [Oesophagostomum dentatum]
MRITGYSPRNHVGRSRTRHGHLWRVRVHQHRRLNGFSCRETLGKSKRNEPGRERESERGISSAEDNITAEVCSFTVTFY